jgi:hypothetical protein
VAIFAAIAVGIGLKFYFFSPPVAVAEAFGMDIAAIDPAASLSMPRQELNDMAFGESEKLRLRWRRLPGGSQEAQKART